MDFLLFPPRCAFAPDDSCKSALQARYVEITPVLRALRRAEAVVVRRFEAWEASLTLHVKITISFPGRSHESRGYKSAELSAKGT